jgi:hypothetical protein
MENSRFGTVKKKIRTASYFEALNGCQPLLKEVLTGCSSQENGMSDARIQIQETILSFAPNRTSLFLKKFRMVVKSVIPIQAKPPDWIANILLTYKSVSSSAWLSLCWAILSDSSIT